MSERKTELIFSEGNGVTADIGKAIGHLSAPARLNMPIAMHELAELYRNNVTGGCHNALHVRQILLLILLLVVQKSCTVWCLG